MAEEFRGARASNAGDDYHELWACRQALRLLSADEGLTALALEGVGGTDAKGASIDTWDGVDCTLYFGGESADEADHVTIEQLKYSAADPHSPWSIARLVSGTTRAKSVVARIAKSWSGLAGMRQGKAAPQVVLISNQPAAETLPEAIVDAAQLVAVPSRKPLSTASAAQRLAYATGLDAELFRQFASNLRLELGAGSRFALEERLLGAMAEWTDGDVRLPVSRLREYVRAHMRPERAGELITRESLLLLFGVSQEEAMFPCPPQIRTVVAPVSRAPVQLAAERLVEGERFICLHGVGGVGKTTALQEIEAALPAGSVTIKFDCYGDGRYLDASEPRHRGDQAFLQLANELAMRLRLPLLLSPYGGLDLLRAFVARLERAAATLAMAGPNALIVIAIDAADNSVRAAQSRMPAEASFVHDFVQLQPKAANIRFVVTARTGHLDALRLPQGYQRIEVEPFSREETGAFVARTWSAPDPWIDDFHHFSGGVARVQNYALEGLANDPAAALDRLRPLGKTLDGIFRERFEEARSKNAGSAEVAKLCAGLIALPRPVPVAALAAAVGMTGAQVADICADLAPMTRLNQATVGFADEDFEAFVRAEAQAELDEVRQRTADWMTANANRDEYAARNVAFALVGAERGRELLDLVEREPAPQAIADPVLRREAELQRLRLAIAVCQQAGDTVRALRFVLIGAEGLKTEAALRDLLVSNPDLATRFAPDTAARLILADADHVSDHGPFLFHKLAADADRSDAISVREGRRQVSAWLQARDMARRDDDGAPGTAWAIGAPDISASVEARLKLDGPGPALRGLSTWTPRRVVFEVADALVPRMIAEGHAPAVQALATDHLKSRSALFLLVPLALAGHAIDTGLLEGGLAVWARGNLRVSRFFEGYENDGSLHERVLDAALTSCEILTWFGEGDELVETVLSAFLVPELRRVDRRHDHEPAKLSFLMRAYALKEARAGREAKAADLFTTRPEPPAESKPQRSSRSTEEHDRPLLELTGSVLGTYAAVADALVHCRDNAEVDAALGKAVGRLRNDEWRMTRQHGAGGLRGRAATALLVLLATGRDATILKRHACAVDARWGEAGMQPFEPLISRLSLRADLHGELLADLVRLAQGTRKLRIGADEKSKLLVGLARLMRPLSPDDANAVFNFAVEAASELDSEIMAQLRLLDTLTQQGSPSFADARRTSGELVFLVNDAAIRLDGYEHFPWDAAMSALARLDVQTALAASARWDDADVARLVETLPPVLKQALADGRVSPAQAAALDLICVDDGDILDAALERAEQDGGSAFSTLAEEIAQGELVGSGRGRLGSRLSELAKSGRCAVPGAETLARRHDYLESLLKAPERKPADARPTKPDRREALASQGWSRKILLDGVALHAAVKGLQRELRDSGSYVGSDQILATARRDVQPRDRLAHLAALALEPEGFGLDALLLALGEWAESPAVQAWAATELPKIIVSELPYLARFLHHGEGTLGKWLDRASLNGPARHACLLAGLGQHVGQMGANQVFALAGLVGAALAPVDAAELATWYVDRLSARILVDDREYAIPDGALPASTDVAVARFVFAYLGDPDLRLRWRAAHAMRRLARLDERSTLAAMAGEYRRQTEPAFRDPKLPFFWLGARLWFVIAWDRISGERPDVAAPIGSTLLGVALDDEFPHMLVRSFARGACWKLNAAGLMALDQATSERLDGVNKTALPRIEVNKKVARHFGMDEPKRRFTFDSMDTLPYWYQPMIGGFASVDTERFLSLAESWIIDRWGYAGDTRYSDRDRRTGRGTNENWQVQSNRHGSTPTVERLSTHLEWHAMWCVAGELLRTEPLPKREDDYDKLSEKIRRETLTEPPLWLADLLVPTPLYPHFWQAVQTPLAEWLPDVGEAVHRRELFPEDWPDYVVVDSAVEFRTGDRVESASVSTSLVEPSTGGALLRALQAMEDAWDYKMPDEGEDHELEDAPYRFLGWLRRSHRDGGCDDKDPLRGASSVIEMRPGSRVERSCGLRRDPGGLPIWTSNGATTPMFRFEVWGEREKDNERFMSGLAVQGHRLLAHRNQLRAFLEGEGLDLIAEVEVNRRDRRERNHLDEESTEEKEARFDRLYRLRAGGELDIAEGRAGAWSDDRPAA